MLGSSVRFPSCRRDRNSPVVFSGEGISEGLVVAALVTIFVYFGTQHMIKIRNRKDFYIQNGDSMLHKALFTCKNTVTKAKNFTEEELKKATKNFNDARTS